MSPFAFLLGAATLHRATIDRRHFIADVTSQSYIRGILQRRNNSPQLQLPSDLKNNVSNYCKKNLR